MKVLQFEQPKAMKHAFVIIQDEEEIGSVTYTSLSHRKARATILGTEWDFIEKGLLGNKVSVLDGRTQQEFAHYQKPFFKKGIVHIHDKPYTFRSKGFIKSHCFWDDADGNELVAYNYGGLLKTRGDITVDEQLLQDPKLRLLIPLGMFVAFNADEDEAASVSAATG